MPSTAQLLDLLTTRSAPACLPCQERMGAAPPQAPATPAPNPAPAAATASPRTAAWSGTIGVEGELTGDGRLIELNALRWEDLPIPLLAQAQTSDGHDGAVVVGQILTLARKAGGVIHGTGTFDLESAHGLDVAGQIQRNGPSGVSMDLDDVSFEIRVAKELVAELMGDEPLPEDGEDDPAPSNQEPEVDEDGRVTVAKIASDEEVRVATSGRIRGATLVAIPAFATARIDLDDREAALGEAPAAGLAASGAQSEPSAPLSPPAAWFSDPRLDHPTPLTVTPEGQVYGHAAQWGTCHISHTAPGQCLTAPVSSSSYSYFRTGSILTAEGSEVPVGHITMGTRHAADRASAASTLSHYEDTGTVVADVAAGEDAHGIWVSGALRPGVSAEQVRALRASPLSGDWRRIGGALEMVAVLAVNVPGFPIPRTAGLVAGGAVQSLVASGVVPAPGALTPVRLSGAAPARRALIASGAAQAALSAQSLRVRAMSLKIRTERARARF